MSEIFTKEQSEDKVALNRKVTGSEIGTKNALDVTTIGTGNLLEGVLWDYVALVEASTTDTWTFRNGGSGGTNTATIVITYTDSTKATIANVERTV